MAAGSADRLLKGPMIMRIVPALAFILGVAAAAPAHAQDAGFALTVIKTPPLETVIGLRPTASDKAATLDIYPQGNPATSAPAKIHLCNVDLDAGPPAWLCARAQITNGAARFGVDRGGTAPRVPVEIVSGSERLGIFRLQNGETGLPQLIVGPFDSLAVSGQMAAMKRDNAGLSQRLVSTQRANSILKASLSKMEAKLLSIETRLRALEK